MESSVLSINEIKEQHYYVDEVQVPNRIAFNLVKRLFDIVISFLCSLYCFFLCS